MHHDYQRSSASWESEIQRHTPGPPPSVLLLRGQLSSAGVHLSLGSPALGSRASIPTALLIPAPSALGAERELWPLKGEDTEVLEWVLASCPGPSSAGILFAAPSPTWKPLPKLPHSSSPRVCSLSPWVPTPPTFAPPPRHPRRPSLAHLHAFAHTLLCLLLCSSFSAHQCPWLRVRH